MDTVCRINPNLAGSCSRREHACTRLRFSSRPGSGRFRNFTAVVLIASILAAGGCATVGPNFSPPPASVAEGWIDHGDPKVKTAQVDYAEWWKVFNDPVLDSLIDTAYRQNLTLQAAGLRIIEARAQLGIALGNQFPQQQQVQAGYSYNETSRNAPNTAGAGDLHYQLYNYSFDASWELDFWGRFKRAIESADAALIASMADYDDVLITLLADVASTYVLVCIFDERIEVARENVELQKQSLRLTEVLFRNGAVTELDVQQARSLLYDTQAQIPQLEIGLRQARNALSILLGVPPQDLTPMLGEDFRKIPAAPEEVTLGIPAELIMRRPDVRAAELQAAAQCAQIGVARADLFPSIILTGSFGFLSSDSSLTRTGGSSFGDLFDWKSFTMTTGPSIQWPILNYGRIKNNVRLQDARFQELLVNYQNTVLLAAQEVEDALIAFLRSQDQAAFLFESVKAAKRAVDLSFIQYREGAVDYTRVLNTQQALVQQQDRLTQSRGAVPTNLIALYKALGGGWQIRVGREYLSEENLQAMRKRTDWGRLLPPTDLPRTLDPPPPADVRSLPKRPDW